MKMHLYPILFCLLFLSGHAAAQAMAISYQGKLTDAGAPANGQYDLTFKLFDQLSGGTQIGSNILRDDVVVAAGIFTVSLDFGASPFTTNTGNYLEILVRPGVSTSSFTLLTPRQPISNSPYAIQTLRAASAVVADNATNLGGMSASQYVQTTDSRMSNARVPTAGSPDYVQNTTSPQSANFNINGGGSANIFNAVTQYNLGGNRVLSVGGSNNLLAGVGAGQTSTGNENAFFGASAGQANTTGSSNSFFGQGAGQSNLGASFNAFYGAGAGFSNWDGLENSFFGQNAGYNSKGSNNSFFGRFAGNANVLGGSNTFFGYSANPTVSNLSNASAVGSNAAVSQSNSVVLGSIAGVNGAVASVNVGIGTTAPQQNLHVVGNEILSTGSQAGFKFRDRGSLLPADDWVWYSFGNTARFFRNSTGDLWTILPNGNTGIGISPTFRLHVVDPSNTGLRVQTNIAGGTVASFGGSGTFQVDAPGVAGGRIHIAENGNVGIGTNNPKVKLETPGPIYLSSAFGGIIMKSPGGFCFRILINDVGQLGSSQITCP